MKRLTEVLGLISLLLVVACGHDKSYNTVTKIFPDGSCYREFSESGDSSFMVGNTDDSNPFPVAIDSTWKISWTYSAATGQRKYSGNWPLKQWKWDRDTSKHLSLDVMMRKKYPSVEAMSKTFRFNHSSWDSILPKAKLEKRFKWFFTFYEYKEVYPKYNPLKLVPIDSFLTKNEILLYTGDNPKFSPGQNGLEIHNLLNEIDEKKEIWLNYNFFEEYYRIIQKDLPFIEGISLNADTFASLKDSVFKTVKDNFEREPKNFLEYLDKFYKTKTFSALSDTSKAMVDLKMFKKRFEKPFSEYLNYNLLMPGKLIQTNSKQTHGDTLTWKVDVYRFYFNDYEIYAESRVANIWAFVVSVLFILVVVLSFFIKRKP